jgi:hypothetical protein
MLISTGCPRQWRPDPSEHSLRINPPTYAIVDFLTPTIFHEPWWLDIATEGRYSVVEVIESGQVVARLPFFLRKKMGIATASLPPLTHFFGPAVKPIAAPLRRIDITKELLGKLPSASSLYFKCHREIQDTIAFQCTGFRTFVQFTHEIHPQAADVLWNNVHVKARRIIRRASECHSISIGEDPGAFTQFYHQCIEKRGETNYINAAICQRLVQACLERDRGRIYEAKDRSGTLMAAIFCIWDNSSCYYLMTSRDPVAHLGAISLLVWEAITDTAKRGLIFDFDGVSTEGGARFAYNFTSNVVPRYIALRESIPMHLYRSARYMFERPVPFL